MNLQWKDVVVCPDGTTKRSNHYPTNWHPTQCLRWSELSSALIKKWQLKEMQQTHSQSRQRDKRSTQQQQQEQRSRMRKKEQTLSEAAEPGKLEDCFPFYSPLCLLSSSPFPLRSSHCACACVYVCVWESVCEWVSSNSLPFCLSAAQLRQFSGNEWERTENCCTCKWLTPSHMIR